MYVIITSAAPHRKGLFTALESVCPVCVIRKQLRRKTDGRLKFRGGVKSALKNSTLF